MDNQPDIKQTIADVAELIVEAVGPCNDSTLCVAVGSFENRQQFTFSALMSRFDEHPEIVDGNLFCAVSVFDGNGFKADNAISSGAIFIDVDYGSVGHSGTTRFNSQVEIITHLMNQPIPPSMIWGTGHGVQAVYLLEQSVHYADTKMAATLLEAKKLICAATYSDKVTSPAQLFRLPGTVNDKSQQYPEAVPVRGTILKPMDKTCRYTLEDIISKFQPQMAASSYTDLPVAPPTEHSLEWLLGTDHSKGTRSEMFFRTVKAAKAQGHTENEICNMISTNRTFVGKYGKRLSDEVRRCISKLQTPALQTITASELSKKEYPPVKWVVRELLPEGLALVVSAPKIGKSFMMLHVAAEVSCGGLVFGKLKVSQSEVLYLALEDSERRLKERLGNVYPGRDFPGLCFATVLPGDKQNAVESIEQFVRSHLDCGLVIVDTLARIRPVDKRSANAYQLDTEFMERLHRLALDNRMAIVLVHHNRKAVTKDVFESISGSQGIFGVADTAIVITGKRNSSERIMHINGREVLDRQLLMNFDDQHWTLIGDVHDEKMSEQRREILDLLTTEPMLTPTQVAEKLHKQRANINKMMRSLEDDGHVTKDMESRYKINETIKEGV